MNKVIRTVHILLLAVVVFGVHVHRNNVGQSIVVNIGNVVAHCVLRRMLKTITCPFTKGSVLIIDVKQVASIKVVGYIYIFPAIVINVGNGNAQAIAFVPYASL